MESTPRTRHTRPVSLLRLFIALVCFLTRLGDCLGLLRCIQTASKYSLACKESGCKFKLLGEVNSSLHIKGGAQPGNLSSSDSFQITFSGCFASTWPISRCRCAFLVHISCTHFLHHHTKNTRNRRPLVHHRISPHHNAD